MEYCSSNLEHTLVNNEPWQNELNLVWLSGCTGIPVNVSIEPLFVKSLKLSWFKLDNLGKALRMSLKIGSAWANRLKISNQKALVKFPLLDK